MNEPHPKDGWSALLSGKNGIRSLTLAGGVALHAINVYIVITILPSLVREIGGQDYYSWAATIFVIASLLGASFAAKLLFATGPRLAYIISALTFAVGTLICAIAPDMLLFLLGRLIQGFGGGFLLSLSYSMVHIVFEKRFWPMALGIISGVWGISTLIGPAIGGIFDQYYSWRTAFWLVTIIALLFTIIAFCVLPKHNNAMNKPGAVPATQLFLLTLLVLVISVGSTLPTTFAKIAGLVLGALLLIMLAFVDNKAKKPLLPERSFQWKTGFLPIYLLMLGLSIAVNGAELYLPYFLQCLHGQSPLFAGYIASLMSIGWTCGTLSSANASTRNIPFIVLCAPIISFAGIIMLLITVPQPSIALGLLAAICLALLFIGIGTGASWPHLLNRILHLADGENTARASASLTTVQLFSTALSAAVAGTVTNLAGINDASRVAGATSAASALFIGFGVVLLCSLPCAWAVFKALRQPQTTTKISDAHPVQRDG